MKYYSQNFHPSFLSIHSRNLCCLSVAFLNMNVLSSFLFLIIYYIYTFPLLELIARGVAKALSFTKARCSTATSEQLKLKHCQRINENLHVLDSVPTLLA